VARYLTLIGVIPSLADRKALALEV
jgi:hypothetical protein